MVCVTEAKMYTLYNSESNRSMIVDSWETINYKAIEIIIRPLWCIQLYSVYYLGSWNLSCHG